MADSVVGVVLLAGIALCIYRKREGIRRALQLKKAADAATSPLKGTPVVAKLELPKVRDLRYKRNDKKTEQPDLEKQITKQSTSIMVEDAKKATKKEEKKPAKPVRNETSRQEKLALLEEGLFGRRQEGPPIAKEGLRNLTNVASAVAPPSTLPRASPVSSALQAPVVDRSGSCEPEPLSKAPVTLQDFESTTPLGSPVAIAGLPQILIRKATNNNPEDLALPESPKRMSPPCPISAGMRNPPLPPMPGAFGDE